MSTTDAPPEPGSGEPEPPCVEVTESREAQVGRFTVRRALPRRGRRTVGASNKPQTAAMAPEIAHTSEVTRLTRIPFRYAASWFCDAA